MGRAFQNDAFQRMLGASGNRAGLWELGQQPQQQAFQNALALSQLPVALQNAITGAGGLRTESLLGMAGSFLNASQATPSPLLEGITAAGGLMSGIGALRGQ